MGEEILTVPELPSTPTHLDGHWYIPGLEPYPNTRGIGENDESMITKLAIISDGLSSPSLADEIINSAK